MSGPADRLRERIAANGPVTFAEFMEESLYGDGGYYARQDLKIGKEGGDFVTGSSLSPLFGRSTARLLEKLDGVLGGQADYLEAGYGGGEHLRHLVDSLDGSDDRRLLAWDRVSRSIPAGVTSLGELEELPEKGLRGLIFSYELFDALPVHRLVGLEGGEFEELWVSLDGAGQFSYEQKGISSPELAELVGSTGVELEPGQVADLSPHWRTLYRDLANRLDQGLIVTCDYGFEARTLLDPRIRKAGTVACYKQHRVHRNALTNVGDQDLTAHVDFSALREEGERLGLETFALTRQAHWLVACGVFQGLGKSPQETRFEAMSLLDPAGMGEEIRVLVQGRGVAPETLFEVALTGLRPPIQ